MTGKLLLIFSVHAFSVLSVWNPNPLPSSAKLHPDAIKKQLGFLPIFALLTICNAVNIAIKVLPVPAELLQAQITPLDIALFSIGLVGIILRMWSYYVLGRFFTFDLTIRENHSLITKGPYAYLRHPSYTAFTLVYSAFFELVIVPYVRMVSRDLVLVARAVFYVGAAMSFASRISCEEKMLSKEFKGEWQKYAAGRWRMIPFVY